MRRTSWASTGNLEGRSGCIACRNAFSLDSMIARSPGRVNQHGNIDRSICFNLDQGEPCRRPPLPAGHNLHWFLDIMRQVYTCIGRKMTNMEDESLTNTCHIGRKSQLRWAIQKSCWTVRRRKNERNKYAIRY